jgi:hypothetical protein
LTGTKTQKVFTILLVASLAIGMFSLVNWLVNVYPQYHHLFNATLFLRRSTDALTNEEKIACLEQAVILYKEGPYLAKIQSLSSQNTTEEIKRIEGLVRQEYRSSSLNLRHMSTATFEVLFIVISIAGFIYCKQGDLCWNTRKQRFTFGVTPFILAIVIVALHVL